MLTSYCIQPPDSLQNHINASDSLNSPTSALESFSIPSLTPLLVSTNTTQFLIPVDPDFQSESLRVVLRVPTVNLHSMQNTI